MGTETISRFVFSHCIRWYRPYIRYNNHYSIGVDGNDFAALVMENHERYLHRGRMFPNGTRVD